MPMLIWIVRAVAVAAVVSLLTAVPARAIPSPEIIVGSISSLSQLVAVISALLGGGTLVAFGGAGTKGQGERRVRTLARLAIAFGALAAMLATIAVYQWRTAASERQARLSATLTRPSRLPGQPQLDPTLKELGPAEQARHPLGMSAAEAEALIPRAAELGYEIVDIREKAEVEMGTFDGARPMRYPDFLAQRPDLSGRKVLLVCHNGNRSSETCQALAALGIDCRFIVGGLERWITEGRRAAGFYRASVLEARAVPAYPGNDRLLDTGEARDLIERETAVVVDTRYPGEFAAGHLPGAVNIPMRRMTTPELDAALDRLPAKPILVACYDRRSCFFGELVGLSLWRNGRDFRGRYTLPWEYFPVPAPPPHIVAALAERDLGLWGRARRAIAAWIDGLARSWGFMSCLLGLAVLSRLVILPFALKAERDQIAAERIAPEVASLERHLASDPARRARALSQLYRRHGLTPVFNLVALLGLPIMMLAGGALADAASLGGHSHPLLGRLGEPDATFLLPISAAALIGFYVEWALCRTRRHRLLAWLLLTPALVAMLALLPAATNLYVAASAVLLILQRIAAKAAPRDWLVRQRRKLSRHHVAEGIVPLAMAAGRDDVGNKAMRLGALLGKGIPVPDGVVLTPAFVARWSEVAPDDRRRLCRRIVRAAGRGPFAVRSSAAAEDQAAASHAGVFESVTDVTEDGLAEAIDRVAASFGSGRAATYGTGAGEGAILVQRMIAGRHAGVLFTRAPDAAGLSLVEVVTGGAEALVSGRARPSAYRFGRRSLSPVDGASPPLDLRPLLEIGARIEEVIGRAQDIEWVSDGRRLWIVQSRDITASASDTPALVLAEWDRALALAAPSAATRHGDVAPALARNEMCELLPRPTPASHSLIEALHASGGSADLAARALGLAYRVEESPPPLFPCLFGRLYYNAAEAARRAPRISRLDARRIVRQAPAIERRLRDVVLPALARRLELPAAADYDTLETAALVRIASEIVETFVTATHVEAEIVNITAEIVLGEARRVLLAAGRDPSAWLARSGRTIEETALLRAIAAPPGERRAALLAGIGHRSRLDYELAEPRFAESLPALEAYVAVRSSALVEPPVASAETGEPPLAAREVRLVELAGRLQVLKEDAKHAVLAELAVLRRAMIALDRRLGLDGRIFHLTIEEIVNLAPADYEVAAAVAGARAGEAALLAEAGPLPLPATLVAIECASAPSAGPAVAHRLADDAIAGTRVSGSHSARGRAFVVPPAQAEDGKPLDGFSPGDVIVAPFVHPAWLGEVLASAGVVAGSGGWLSHMAIVARERNIPMIVGADGWHRIPQGASVALEMDGSVRVLTG
ncbi:MAG: PEP/pyruvate-binding domain-containing protein [Hyphomicrobiaceae bacterium]